ncbi:MAG: LysR family transcriptional regulator, partial [Methyloligellaceae bacterium]
MDWKSVSFDWNQVRGFYATAEEGSLSAAARALGLTQPTLGRQVAALEEELGVILFDRIGRGLKLTQAGQELMEQVGTMVEAANRISLIASGRAEALEGQVRITASDILSAYILPPAIGEIRQAAPGIDI